eukprot:SAG31_NODE_817_length_11849_cov_6.737362_10_plen_95_part_00
MYAAYQLFFIVCTLATGVLTWVVKKSEATAGGAPPPPEFKAFQKNYLVVYYLAMMGDWLQGPYVYALYSSYGFSQVRFRDHRLGICGGLISPAC